MKFSIYAMILCISYCHLIVPSMSYSYTPKVYNANGCLIYPTSQELHKESALQAKLTLGLGGDADIGQVYDVKIIEEKQKKRIKEAGKVKEIRTTVIPQMIVLRTTQQFKINLTWHKLAIDPQVQYKEIDDTPLAPSPMYACVNSSHEWRIVARNHPKTDAIPAHITLEIYHETTEETEH